MRPQSETGEKGYELNFDKAPVATVAKAILADILGSVTSSIRARKEQSAFHRRGRFQEKT